MKTTRISYLAVATLLAASLATGAQAGTLENLERERVIALDTLLTPDLEREERQTKALTSRARLVDLERMVLRDDSLRGRNTPVVRTAFQNYDLTFLVHASSEKNRSVLDHWLEQIGVSTQTLMSARAGRR